MDRIATDRLTASCHFMEVALWWEYNMSQGRAKTPCTKAEVGAKYFLTLFSLLSLPARIFPKKTKFEIPQFPESSAFTIFSECNKISHKVEKLLLQAEHSVKQCCRSSRAPPRQETAAVWAHTSHNAYLPLAGSCKSPIGWKLLVTLGQRAL